MIRPSLSVLAFAAALCAGAASAQTVLTASTWVPPTHALSTSQKEWCDLLEKNTTGKMKCNILPRGVSNPPGTFDAVKNGLADISFTVHGYTPGRFVATQMAEFPFLGNTSEPISVAFNKVAHEVPAVRRRTPGRQGAGVLHARPRHRVQHQEADHQGRRSGGPEVPRRRRHGQRDHQDAQHERHAQARHRLVRTAVGWRDGRHPVPRRIDRVVQDRQDRQARHILPGWPVQHQFRLHDEPGQIRQAHGRREKGGGQHFGRNRPHASSGAIGTRSTAAAWP